MSDLLDGIIEHATKVVAGISSRVGSEDKLDYVPSRLISYYLAALQVRATQRQADALERLVELAELEVVGDE